MNEISDQCCSFILTSAVWCSSHAYGGNWIFVWLWFFIRLRNYGLVDKHNQIVNIGKVGPADSVTKIWDFLDHSVWEQKINQACKNKSIFQSNWWKVPWKQTAHLSFYFSSEVIYIYSEPLKKHQGNCYGIGKVQISWRHKGLLPKHHISFKTQQKLES